LFEAIPAAEEEDPDAEAEEDERLGGWGGRSQFTRWHGWNSVGLDWPKDSDIKREYVISSRYFELENVLER
jgi:hypothetical protein